MFVVVVVWRGDVSSRYPFHSIGMAEEAFDAAVKIDGVAKVELFSAIGPAERLLKEWHKE